MKAVFNFIKEILESIVVALIITFICFKFVFMSAIVDGTSMHPTLKNGERGLSFIVTRNIGIDRFDICVIDTDKNEDLLVKRIIGLPNETIEYKDNILYIDGNVVEEYFLNDDVYTDDYSIALGDNEYLCLGDNRGVSRDSRYYGPFTKEEIKSTNFFVYAPFSELGMK